VGRAWRRGRSWLGVVGVGGVVGRGGRRRRRRAGRGERLRGEAESHGFVGDLAFRGTSSSHSFEAAASAQLGGRQHLQFPAQGLRQLEVVRATVGISENRKFRA